MTTITAFMCCKDAIWSVEAWLENVKEADEIIIQDGGSTDGTREKLIYYQNNNPKITLLLQTENTEKFKWNEEAVRNQFLGLFKTDWILLMDADELIEDNFWEWFRNTDHNKETEKIGYYIPHKNLWLDKNLFNIAQPWHPDITLRLFKNHRGFFWVGSEHASLWRMGQTKSGTGVCSPEDEETPIIGDDIHFVHYHRAEAKYKDKILNDEILHHSNEKNNMNLQPILARLRKQPKGAELIRSRFE
jgi:glycosyltransferase involved in cell wall biosynthesis